MLAVTCTVAGTGAIAGTAIPAAATAHSARTAVRASSSGTAQAMKTCGAGSVCSTSLSSPQPVTSQPPGRKRRKAYRPGPTSTFNVVAQSQTTRPISADSTMVEKLDAGEPLTCAGYKRRDTSWFEFTLTAKTRIGIVYRISDTIHNTTPLGVRFCAGLPYAFKTFSGKPAVHTTLPDGTAGYVGLLRNCVRNQAGKIVTRDPCVAAVRKAGAVNTIVSVRIPATSQADPWGGA